MSLVILYLLNVDGPLHDLGSARIETGEGIVLRNESLLHRLIVDGTQVAHKKKRWYSGIIPIFPDSSRNASSERR